MTHSAEAVDLVRALATELAWFRRRPDAAGRRHVGVGMFALCNADPVMATPSACSPRCTRIHHLLGLAADWCGVDVETFTETPKPKKRKAVPA